MVAANSNETARNNLLTQELSEAVLDAEIRIGELMREANPEIVEQVKHMLK